MNKMVKELFWAIINGETIEDRIDDTAMREASHELEGVITVALLTKSIMAVYPKDDTDDLIKELMKCPAIMGLMEDIGGKDALRELVEGDNMNIITELIANHQNETGLHYFQLGFEVAKQLLTGTSSVDLSPRGVDA